MPISGASGGGGTARSIRAGSAFIEFFTDTTRLTKGLDEIKSRLSGLGGFFSDVSRKFAPTALLEGTLGRLKERIVNFGSDAVTGTDRVRSNVETVEGFMKRLSVSLRDSAKYWSDWRESMTSPADKLRSIEDELTLRRPGAQSLANDYNATIRDIERVRTDTSFRGFVDFVTGRDMKKEEMFNQQRLATGATFQQYMDRINDLNLQKFYLENPDRDPKRQAFFNSQIEAVRTEGRRARMTPDEILKDVFKGMGADKEVMWTLSRAMEMRDIAKYGHVPQADPLLSTALNAYAMLGRDAKWADSKIDLDALRAAADGATKVITSTRFAGQQLNIGEKRQEIDLLTSIDKAVNKTVDAVNNIGRVLY